MCLFLHVRAEPRVFPSSLSPTRQLACCTLLPHGNVDNHVSGSDEAIIAGKNPKTETVDRPASIANNREVGGGGAQKQNERRSRVCGSVCVLPDKQDITDGLTFAKTLSHYKKKKQLICPPEFSPFSESPRETVPQTRE